MNRRLIYQIAIIAFTTLILAIVAVATMPIWFTIGMINPDIYAGFSQRLMREFTIRMTRGMMAHGR